MDSNHCRRKPTDLQSALGRPELLPFVSPIGPELGLLSVVVSVRPPMPHPTCDKRRDNFWFRELWRSCAETVCRLSGPIRSAVGAYDGVITRFAQCEKVLRAAGITPAPITRTLLNQLRR